MTGAAFNTSERNRSNKASASFPEMMEPLNHKRTIKILFLPGLGIYGFFSSFFCSIPVWEPRKFVVLH